MKLGLEQVVGGLERCWWQSEPGRHLVPSSSAASLAPPPALLSAGCPTQLAPGGRLLNQPSTRGLTQHTTHIRSTLHYLHPIVQPGRMSNSRIMTLKPPPDSLTRLIFPSEVGQRLAAAVDCQLCWKPGGTGNKKSESRVGSPRQKIP